jgi:periplasmic divalent cation tolerance protein
MRYVLRRVRAVGAGAEVRAMAGGAQGPAERALLVLVTVPTAEKAVELARTLVTERLAACGNVVPGLRSIYRWDGAVQDEREALLLLKTTAGRFEQLRDRVLALHPYQVPEVVALPIEAGSRAYLDWIAAETR